MKLRVTSSGKRGACHTHVFDAETGEPLLGVRSVRFVQESVDPLPHLIIELIDFEIDAEAEADVIETPAPDAPRLLVTSDGKLSRESITHLRRLMEQCRADPRPILIDAGLHVYQLVDGRWLPIERTDPPLTSEAIDTWHDDGGPILPHD